MLNLNSTIELDAKKFYRWWSRELAFLVPDKIKQLVNDRIGYVVVRAAGSRLQLSYHEGSAVESLGELDRNENGLPQYKALLEKDPRLAKANFILRLSRKDAISKELTLPAAARENLQQVIAYELSRFTPFKPEQVYFALKPVEGDREPGLIKVSLVLTPRETLDTLYEELTLLGISPLYADYEDAANELEPGSEMYNLLPDQYQQRTAKTSQRIYLALFVAALLLLGGLIGLPVWFQSQTVDMLQERIDAIEKEAKSISALQSGVDDIIEETRKLIEVKNAKPPVVEVLNELSRLIKDDTWLSYAQYSEGHLQIQGESPAASTLIGILEDSELFANARFVSPVTQDTSTGMERFQITFDITSKGKPENEAE
ncbi:MAG: PilN domain-containing protein [Gammaproteobacteria bacterium]